MWIDFCGYQFGLFPLIMKIAYVDSVTNHQFMKFYIATSLQKIDCNIAF